MSRKARIATLACVVFVSAVGVSAAAAAPVQLSLSQATAFSVLGASCGGIQEKAYATGFDASSGYPTGAVYLSTSCGGSGRGGGYHTTTYSAWVTVSWDFTAAVISYQRLSAAPTTNATLSVSDAHGNQLYNQSNSAYLALAAGFVPAARVTAVSATSGPVAGGTTLTITGTGLTGATGVSFGAVAARSFTVNSSTSITATSPAAGAGTVDVTVTNAGGRSATSASDRFTFVAVPSVSSLSPNTGAVYGGTQVTITGAHFTDATAVSFGGTQAGFVVDSDSSITAFAPAAEAAGSVYVTVTTVGGKSARTTTARFSYVAVTPVVTGIDPSVGPEDGGTWVTITGVNLTGVTQVDFGGIAADFWVDSDTSIEAVSPAGSVGMVDVRVTAFGRTSATSASDQFTFVTAPLVSAADPNLGPEDGGTVVTITGASLTGATEVDFGGVPADFVVDGDTSITAVSPPGAGTVDVTVTTDGGTSAASADDQFTYVAAPSVSGVSPNAGSVDGGTSVTITGSNFTDATEVDFGGLPADFVVDSDSSITAVSPQAGAGMVDVTVTTVGGTSTGSADDQFTYS